MRNKSISKSRKMFMGTKKVNRIIEPSFGGQFSVKDFNEKLKANEDVSVNFDGKPLYPYPKRSSK